MAGSVNKVILIGNLGADPETRTTGSGREVVNLRLATSREWTDKAGERQERTEWHTVVCWGKLAELAARYLAKGRKVYVEGRLETRDWIDQTTGDKRYRTDVVAQEVTFLDSKADRQDVEQDARDHGRRAQAPDDRPRRPRAPRQDDPPTGKIGPDGNPWRDDDVPF